MIEIMVRGDPHDAARLIHRELHALSERVNNLEIKMADDATKLTDDITALQAAEADTKTRVGTAVAALQAQIDDLKAHPASADLSAQIAALEATTADLATIAPATPPTT